jgi:hypothetical protein
MAIPLITNYLLHTFLWFSKTSDIAIFNKSSCITVQQKYTQLNSTYH